MARAGVHFPSPRSASTIESPFSPSRSRSTTRTPASPERAARSPSVNVSADLDNVAAGLQVEANFLREFAVGPRSTRTRLQPPGFGCTSVECAQVYGRRNVAHPSSCRGVLLRLHLRACAGANHISCRLSRFVTEVEVVELEISRGPVLRCRSVRCTESYHAKPNAHQHIPVSRQTQICDLADTDS